MKQKSDDILTLFYALDRVNFKIISLNMTNSQLMNEFHFKLNNERKWDYATITNDPINELICYRYKSN